MASISFRVPTRCQTFGKQKINAMRPLKLNRTAGPEASHLPAQQRWELGNRFHGRVDLEPQLLGNLGCAALNPKRPQSGRLCRATVPIIGGDEAELGIAYLQAFGSKQVELENWS